MQIELALDEQRKDSYISICASIDNTRDLSLQIEIDDMGLTALKDKVLSL